MSPSGRIPGPLPKVTVAVLSWNRLHYLRATLESARQCIRYPHLEWIVSDNESNEPGLREYLQSLPWIDRLIVKQQTHAAAMNEIVSLASGDFLLLWPDDMQFTVAGGWMEDVVEIMRDNTDVGSVGLNYLRRTTLRNLFNSPNPRDAADGVQELRRYGSGFRRQRFLSSCRSFRMRTLGWKLPGIFGSGIPGITRTDIWRSLGPWKTRATAELKDSSLGAEDYMVARYFDSQLRLQVAIPMAPVAADIITDPLGCKAKVRGRYRYGVYMPPPSGLFYYRIRNDADLPAVAGSLPLSFTEAVEPLGFTLPLDASGELLKASINVSVVYDHIANRAIPYPLASSPPDAPGAPRT